MDHSVFSLSSSARPYQLLMQSFAAWLLNNELDPPTAVPLGYSRRQTLVITAAITH